MKRDKKATRRVAGRKRARSGPKPDYNPPAWKLKTPRRTRVRPHFGRNNYRVGVVRVSMHPDLVRKLNISAKFYGRTREEIIVMACEQWVKE